MPMKPLSRASLLLLALGAAACEGDGPTQREPRVARVFVTPASATLNPGGTTQLSATARDDENTAVPDVAFAWSTLDGGVATVSGAGLVTAVAGGTARIVATAPSGPADTALITVIAVATECTPAATPQLAVGGSVTVSGAQAALLCLEGTAAGAEYTVIPFHGTTSPQATLGVRVTPTGTQGVTGPPNPAVSPSLSLQALSRQAAARGDGGYHTRLNERARGYLSRLVPGARDAYRRRALGPRMAQQQTTPTIGTVLNLNVGQEFCTEPDRRGGRVVAVSNRAVIVADTMNPAGGFTQADYEHVAATFDTLIYPVNVAAFGEPLDVDQNGRVVIFYTRAVNELTPANVNYVVGGFFYGRDLFPLTADDRFPACGGSNFAEMFYMLAPDPAGAVNGNIRSTAYVRNSTLGVVGHEFQHLISASRRLYVVPGVGGTAWSEDAFLNEGLSHIAEELLFYHRAQRAPRANLDASILGVQPARNAFLEFQDANHGRYGLWLQNPDQDSPYDEAFGEVDDLSTRGAAWAFLRYVADRRGSDGTLWYDLVNNAFTGLDNLRETLGTDPIPLFRDWAVAAYTDDAVPGVPAAFTHPSWNYRSLYQTLDSRYPLETTVLNAGMATNLSLVAGGSAYLRAGVAPGQRASIAVTASNAAPPQQLSVTVVRTK
jgi:Bacterial Ig-like domain (group 2)